MEQLIRQVQIQEDTIYQQIQMETILSDYREVGPNNASSDTITACDSLVWNGTTYTTSGTYTFSTTNMSGCDSVATLVLTIEPTEVAQFSYDTTNYCNVSIDPTPTITGTNRWISLQQHRVDQ